MRTRRGVGRQVGRSGDEPGSAGARPSVLQLVWFGVLETPSPLERIPGRSRPLAATAAMSSNSFAYNEQSGGGEAAELGQEATSTISPSGAFGLFSSDWKK